MADKSKQHWQNVQERKRKEAEKEYAEFDRFMRVTNSMMCDLANAFDSFKAAHMQEEQNDDT